MRKSQLFSSASRAVLLGPMTASERRVGRYLRAPEGHSTPTPSPAPAPTPSPSPTPAPAASGAFDFPAQLDSLDSVPAPARPLYVQRDGKFVLDDLSGLRSALEHEKSQRKHWQGKASVASKYEGLGKSPEEIQALIQADNDAEEKRLKDAGDFEALKTQLQTNHANELKAKDTKIAGLTKQIEKILLSDHAQTALADKDIQGNPTLLLPVIRDRVSVEEDETGEFKLVVKTPDGHPMLNSESKPASLRDLAMALKQDANYAGAFKGVNQSGGGASNNNGGGAAPQGNLSRSKMSVTQKTAYIREHGQDAYLKLPA